MFVGLDSIYDAAFGQTMGLPDINSGPDATDSRSDRPVRDGASCGSLLNCTFPLCRLHYGMSAHP